VTRERIARRLAGGLTAVGVLAWVAAAGGTAEDPGVLACAYLASDASPDGPAAVGAMAAGSRVPAVALAGARLRDAPAGDVAAAAAQLARACAAR
jgi:hypothetical protein